MTPTLPALADRRIDIPDAEDVSIAYRDVGAGEPILFIHAWPLTGATYRRLVSHLPGYRAIVPDSPGLGESLAPPETPLGARAQARYFESFVDQLGLDRFTIVAHDTGAMTARLLAATLGDRVPRLVLLDTEIPGERPPGFAWMTRLANLPGASRLYRRLLRWRRFLWSDAGLGAGYRDNAAFEAELMDLYVRPLLEDDRRFAGAMAYGAHVSWKLVDELRDVHAKIPAHVLLVWGEDDPLFSLAGARGMVEQFARCDGVEVLPGGRLCAYDEFAPLAAGHVRAFLERHPAI